MNIQSCKSRTLRCGLSLIETTVATVLVSITLVTSLNTLAFVLQATNRNAQAQRATLIAQFLLAEITSRPFEDPANASTALGIESDESGRSTWDDCDDYQGWSTNSIGTLDGVPLEYAAGWSCSCSVGYCMPANPNMLSTSQTTLKRVDLQLVSPAARTFSFSSLRSANGALLEAQSTGTSVLANVEVSLSSEGKSLSANTRLQNQQESD